MPGDGANAHVRQRQAVLRSSAAGPAPARGSVGYEIHAQLSAERIQHCLIEGGNLDMAWPAPHEHGLALAER